MMVGQAADGGQVGEMVLLISLFNVSSNNRYIYSYH
jgi:hypothetical protein